ncbi:MAG: hypothetical protein GY856_09550 [bacterium]|nr:hypothetical protein [bacterium]
MKQTMIELEEASGRYQGYVYASDRGRPDQQVEMDLVADTEITIREHRCTLGSLTRRLIAFESSFLETIFDERGQLDLGRYLYAQTIGKSGLTERDLPTEADIQIRIVTDDEHIARLPWVLLARASTFLCATGWSVALSRTLEGGAVELPPSPRMLIAIPQPADIEPTEAAPHLEKLEELLSAADHRYYQDRNLRVAHTWEDFGRLAAEFQPQIFYYYGHGISDGHTTRLRFARGDRRRRFDVPVVDLAQHFRQAADGPPLLAYVNCCHGDAGGLLGAGRTLSEIIPAVLTNRTVAFIAAAQAQATEFWRALLLDGEAPHQAVASMHNKLGELGLSFKDTRWMTPVLHRHYADWTSTPPRSTTEISRDPHWRLKLDRVRQFGQVVFQTQEMLRERKPPSLAYIWYGAAGQGVDLFHQRLTVELRHFLGSAHLYQVLPRWPDDLENLHLSFRDMMLEAFDARSLDDIPARIRTQIRGESGRQSLVYMRHTPLGSHSPVRPKVLRTYLEWWDRTFAPLLLEARAFGLLGVSFVVRKPPALLKSLHSHLDNLVLEHTVYQLLDEMERVVRKDLLDFLRSHNVPVPPDRQDRVVEAILTQTGGDYDSTLEALKEVVARAWDLEDENLGDDDEKEEDY